MARDGTLDFNQQFLISGLDTAGLCPTFDYHEYKSGDEPATSRIWQHRQH
jgi:hypothetical protein